MTEEAFIALLRAQESWLMERILHYAKAQGFVRYASTLLEAWRLSIAGLTEALVEGMARFGDGGVEITVDTSWDDDPVARFAVDEARRHRERGVTLGMFLGLFVYYRQAYQDLVRKFLPPGDERVRQEDLVVRLFDRMGTAFCVEWSNLGGQDERDAMSSSLRNMTNEKNRYLTFFEGLSLPALLMDEAGHITNVNAAAARLLDAAAAPGQSYYASRTNDRPGLCGQRLDAVFPWLAEIAHTAMASRDEVVVANVQFSGSSQARHFRAVVSKQPDVSGKFAGHALVLFDVTEDRTKEILVSRAKEELERTFDTISDLVFLTDDAGIILRANKALARQLGVSPRELIGQPCREVLGCPECNFMGQSCSTDGATVSYERILGKYLVSRNTLRDPYGKPYGSVFVARDVAMLERIQSTLQAIEGKYKSIFDNAAEGIFQSTPEGRYLSVNPAMAFIFGFESPLEMRECVSDIGQQMYVDPSVRTAMMEEGLATGQIKSREVQLRRKDGSVFWAILNGRLVNDARGRYFEGFVQDVTELRHFVAELAQSEKRFRSLVETMQQGLVEFDGAGRVLYCNDHFSQLIRRRSEDILGQGLEALVHSEDQEAFRQALALQPGRDQNRHFDIRWATEAGQVFSIVTPVVLQSVQGESTGSWLLVMDVTERKLLESQLLQTQKLEAIGQLAAGIAHEINTPTQYVLNNMWFIKEAIEQIHAAMNRHMELFVQIEAQTPLAAETLAVRQQDADQQIDFYLQELPAAISETLQGLERITSIVRSVKQFAHPGHENKQTVNLNELVTNTVTLSRNEWKYVAELTTDLDPDLPPVPCLMQEIGQVLLNLVINAAHAIIDARGEDGEAKGQIRIRTRRKGNWVEVRVQDSGTGIPPHVQAHIFEPFFTTKPVGSGTGQGLFIAHRSVVRNHGGSIDFKTTPGQGTTFIVRLPLTEKSREGEHV